MRRSPQAPFLWKRWPALDNIRLDLTCPVSVLLSLLKHMGGPDGRRTHQIRYPIGRDDVCSQTAAMGGAGILGARSAMAQSQGSRSQDSLIPPSMLEQGEPVASPPYGVPSKFEKEVVRPADHRDADRSVVVELHATAGSARNDHAERSLLRAPPQRRANHRPRHAPADDPRSRRPAAGLFDERP